jgi:hypothetical protein
MLSFKKFPLTWYFLPLTYGGKLAIKLKMHREFKDTIPPRLKKVPFPLYNGASGTKTRISLGKRPKRIT